MGVALLCVSTVAFAQSEFKHLSAAEIKKAIVGKKLTDGAHWSDKFMPDGTLESIMHGQVQNGRWSVRGGQLCMAYPERKKTAEECYEVWRRGQVLEYRRDGVGIAQGDLVNK
ncbi:MULTISPECIES: hypothetical protein [Ralstonia]|uniref:DUF995 domain-containing protein n=1 Tax=Ralstonia flatus TaxID=3058601 RepID=A0AAD2F643_9RALS|nr:MULTISPECIES: hypothetical protein [Ralstonia]CAJ0884794.1 hypothetical protein R77567_03699 [Ralstonia sp. LMG 32965]CAJ0901086.1 hypothetical protein R77564_04528 [Ralstonia sp. LMG 32965]